MEKEKDQNHTDTINKYKEERCECREDDNCGCPFYDSNVKPETMEKPKTKSCGCDKDKK